MSPRLDIFGGIFSSYREYTTVHDTTLKSYAVPETTDNGGDFSTTLEPCQYRRELQVVFR